eukprot:CAMPEP_0204339938 /NCGR_PEP_ID=MMETSP0469-20131031/22186_1 /ASSEMBLY_ACC=CAM_ASM_000384 /TAXON_ID=2969 /ORGANISM="Oxyrrhis marina" /LENGTH=97 /DNA_ID=CAMNT_0051324357 /DNA_START=10 /DNA_END=303 /DNA_ORIENTATION=-
MVSTELGVLAPLGPMIESERLLDQTCAPGPAGTTLEPASESEGCSHRGRASLPIEMALHPMVALALLLMDLVQPGLEAVLIQSLGLPRLKRGKQAPG